MMPSKRAIYKFCAVIGWMLLFHLEAPQPLHGQTPRTENYIDHPKISRNGNQITMQATSNRPMSLATTGISEEYGYKLDYEDPIFISAAETTNVATPEWIAIHPQKRELLIPLGGSFEVRFSEEFNVAGELNKGEIVSKTVSTYNESGLSGRFTVIEESSHDFAVVGLSSDQKQSPFLGTRISIPKAQRDGAATLKLILDTVSSKTGIPYVIGSRPTRLLKATNVTVGGDDLIARDLIRQILDETGRSLRWLMLYEPTYNTYHFNLAFIVRDEITGSGWHRYVSVDPVPHHTSN
jgi:hypothetical protein